MTKYVGNKEIHEYQVTKKIVLYIALNVFPKFINNNYYCFTYGNKNIDNNR